MAKTFDPSSLSLADQQAFAQWQQSLQQYVAQNGGGVPAPVTYALAKPDYVQSHPELKEGYDIVSGANLPPTVKAALQGYHPTWGKAGEPTNANMTKNSGLWSKWETWLQIGLGAGVAAEVAPAIAAAASAPAAAPAAATGTTAATAGTGATASGTGAAAGGTGAATAGTGASYIGSDIAGTAATSGGAAAMAPTTITGLTTPGVGAAATSPAFATGGATGAAGTSSWWKDLLGIGSKSAAVRTAANLAGNYLQSRQVDKAVQAQVDAANKALDLQSNVYQQQRADLAPYRNVGSASIGELSRLMGLPAGSDTTTPYFQQQAAAQQATAQQNQQAQNRQPPAAPTQAAPRGTISGLGDGFVNMVSPDGRPARVPQAQVNAALQAGGRMA